MKFYQKTWFTVLMLVLCFPIGLILMWKYKKFNKIGRIIISAIIIIGFITNGVLNALGVKTTDDPVSNNTEVQEVKHEEPRKAEEPVKQNIKTLNVSVRELRKYFKEKGFTFKDCPPINGVPRIVGRNGANVLEIQGDDNITKATMSSVMSRDDQKINEQNLLLDCFFKLELCPEFDQDKFMDWIYDIMKKHNGKNYTKKFGDTKITASAVKDIGTLFISVEHV